MSDTVTESEFDSAWNLLRRWYREEITSLAKRIADEAKRDGRNRDDVLHETLDGHEFVIYTFKAQLVIALSENDGACKEATGENPSTDEIRAYWAMHADVTAEWHGEEEEEEEDSGAAGDDQP